MTSPTDATSAAKGAANAASETASSAKGAAKAASDINRAATDAARAASDAARTATEAARTSQDQFVNIVRQSQQAIIDGVSAWASAVDEIVPQTPAIPGLQGLPGLPQPQEVFESAFDFAQKLLDAQRDFARGMIAATAPVRARAEATTSEK